jgi:selenocysteine lyase/cysteine desulfurase
VTGILTDVNKISIILHKKGALSFFDYASAGPYCPIDMNPVIEGPDREFVYKDAIFLSPHKFVGGVGTPGYYHFLSFLFYF